MARQPEIQYIRMYTQGSAARQLEMTPPERKKPKTKLPKPRPEKVTVIRVDPIALCGILVAAVMLVLIVVGCVQLYDAQVRSARLESYVDQLSTQNQVLQDTYASSYDLLEVYEAAVALGMVPKDQVQQVTIHSPEE